MEKSSTSTATSDGAGGRKNCYRGHWRPAEDEKLRQLVERYGPQNWNFIADHLGGRSGKSCRLRWYNQLDPNISKKPFTEEEEERLLSAHRIYGNKWACIAKYFHGRTDNAVKNHYHVVMARRKRERYNTSPLTLAHHHHHTIKNPTTTTSLLHNYQVTPRLGLDYPPVVRPEGSIVITNNYSAQQRRHDQVPFIDFLGVGIISNLS